jgi:ABC-type polysaccharide/polyol phosphate export permease
MLSYLHSIWRCRYFWLSLVRVDLRTRYRRSFLGLGWSLLQPLAMTAIFCAIVRPLLMPERPLAECALFFLSGLICWHFIVNVTVQGCNALFRGEAYIRQYPAPMAIYPLRTALGYAVHFLIALAVVLAFSWVWHGAVDIVALAGLAPGVVLLLLLGWSLAVLTSFANVYYQDTQHLCEVGFQFLFYATPILYGPELLRGRGLEWVMYANPFAPVLQLVREPILLARPAAPVTYLWAGTVVLAFFLAACGTLATQQRRVIFYL